MQADVLHTLQCHKGPLRCGEQVTSAGAGVRCFGWDADAVGADGAAAAASNFGRTPVRIFNEDIVQGKSGLHLLLGAIDPCGGRIVVNSASGKVVLSSWSVPVGRALAGSIGVNAGVMSKRLDPNPGLSSIDPSEVDSKEELLKASGEREDDEAMLPYRSECSAVALAKNTIIIPDCQTRCVCMYKPVMVLLSCSRDRSRDG